jgi:GT2 family glycosyltransferase
MSPSPSVFTVVLNYMNAADTTRCAASLRRCSYPQRLVVVDNASTPDVISELERALPSETLLKAGENLGYAGGNNLGIRYALEGGADFVWILNPDTVVEPDALEHLIDTMTRLPKAGIAGCRILDGKDGGRTIWFNGARIDWSRGSATSHVDIGQPDAQRPDASVRQTDYVTGASMLVRRRVLEDIGLLPERYFLYFEEVDFNVRARRKGWQLVIDSAARIQHFWRSWDKVPSVHYVYYYSRNRVLFGREFSDRSVDGLERDLGKQLESWRRRFRDNSPQWLGGFERVAAMALADARAGRDGKHPGIPGLTWEQVSPRTEPGAPRREPGPCPPT